MQAPHASHNSTIRNIFRGAAIILLPTGAIFTAVGLIDFFASFASPGLPSKFWCAFIGLPMLSLGVFCFKAGFLRTITGYVAGEAAPAVKETAEYVAEGLRPTIQKIWEESQRNEGDSNPATRIRSLEGLKSQGLISEAEYKLKRQEILDEI